MTWALQEMNHHLHSSDPRTPVQEADGPQEPWSNHPVSHIVHYLWSGSNLTQQCLRLLLYRCHLRCSPVAKLKKHSGSQIPTCESAIRAVCASLGASTRLEPGRAWDPLHMKTKGSHPEWKFNPSLLSQPHPPLSASLDRAWIISKVCVFVCVGVLVYVTIYGIWGWWGSLSTRGHCQSKWETNLCFYCFSSWPTTQRTLQHVW